MKQYDDYELNGFSDYNKITKTEETKERYVKRAKQLIKRARHELKIPYDQDLDMRQFVVWLSDHRKNLNARSWRQYKSSVIYYLEIHSDQNVAKDAIEYLKDITAIGLPNKSHKTSGVKMKKITKEDWLKLEKYLNDNFHKIKWAAELRDWLRATIITGLRPIEWKDASINKINGVYILTIKNAKNTNGRSNGEYRNLLLDNISEENLYTVLSHLNNVKTHIAKNKYESFYQACSITMRQAFRACWPRKINRITLYSARHQFSANAKASNLSKAEVAALMGHNIDETAIAHYGRKKSGNEKTEISPLEDEVQKVRQKSVSNYLDLIKKKTTVDSNGQIIEVSDETSGSKESSGQLGARSLTESSSNMVNIENPQNIKNS